MIVQQHGIMFVVLTDVGKSIGNAVRLQVVQGQARYTPAGAIQHGHHAGVDEGGDVGGMMFVSHEQSTVDQRGGGRVVVK